MSNRKSFLLNLARVVMRFAEIRTDNGMLIHEGTLVEGIDVFIEQDGELVPAIDGEYANDEMVITVISGKVESIEKLGEEPVEEPVEEPIEEPVETPMEEEPIVENPTDDKSETDTEAIVEIRKEINELYARIDELEKIIKEKDETIETLNTQLSEIVRPAHNEVTTTIINNKGTKNPALKYFQKQ